MNILGIESSCDETSAAVFSDAGLLSNEIATQAIHEKFGGVVPELASRAHLQKITPVVAVALEKSGLNRADLTGIAVTCGPGLVGSILVGLNFAKALSLALKIPFIGINHIEGHIFANYVLADGPEFPFVTLMISGGHTLLVLVKAFGNYQILGTTRDDAAGEAFDKVAKMLNLGYPGGPIISRVALGANAGFVKFPRPKFKDNPFDFSFSGLKTAVLYFLQKLSPEEVTRYTADIAASFQLAAVEVLLERSFDLLRELGLNRLSVVGGVASNQLLREKLVARAQAENVRVFIPPAVLCTDNAAMIARAGFFRLGQHQSSPLTLSPAPSMPL
jgi:N6-L-threonylcarbamoyladenine synthase